MRHLRFASVAAVLITAASPPAHASLYDGVNLIFGQSPTGARTLTINNSLVLNAVATGWYSEHGYHDGTNANYFAGSTSFNFFHDYVAFDLSGVTGPITSARLSLGQAPARIINGEYTGGFDSDDVTALEFVTHDVTTPIGRLTSSYLEPVNPDAFDIYADLGAGAYYGAVQTSAALNGKQVDLTLNRNALAAIRAAEGHAFAIGGTVALTTDALPADPLPAAPLPASLPMFGGALLILAGGLRLRRRGGASA